MTFNCQFAKEEDGNAKQTKHISKYNDDDDAKEWCFYYPFLCLWSSDQLLIRVLFDKWRSCQQIFLFTIPCIYQPYSLSLSALRNGLRCWIVFSIKIRCQPAACSLRTRSNEGIFGDEKICIEDMWAMTSRHPFLIKNLYSAHCLVTTSRNEFENTNVTAIAASTHLICLKIWIFIWAKYCPSMKQKVWENIWLKYLAS